MGKWKRTLFFWFLVVLFFVIAPAIVLHARGYRFDFDRGVFVYSGTITIKSNPQEVNVVINGDLKESKKLNRINNSYNISGLLPGDYKIEISRNGFQTWRKKTDVHSGLASEFWNVILVRNDYEKTQHPAENIGKFFTSPRNRHIAYTKDTDGSFEVEIFNISDDAKENSFSFPGWQFINESKKENIEWSPEENYISVPAERRIDAEEDTTSSSRIQARLQPEQKTIQYAYFIIDPDNERSFNLNEFLEKKEVSLVRWDPQEKDYLFFLEENKLYRANIRSKEDMTLIAENVSAYDLSRTAVYYVQLPNDLIFKTSLDGKSGREQITNAFPDNNAPSKVSRMIVYDNSRIALVGENKDLFIYNKGEHDTHFRKLSGSVQGAHFSDDGKKLLFWTDNEISVYYVRDWEIQPARSENEMTNVTRYSEPLKNVQWYGDYEHVVFSAGRWMKIIELDSRDHRNCMDLANTAAETPFVIYNYPLGKLYFTDKKGDSTFLYSIDFPEPTAVFGFQV